ncbi:MAG: EF-hand domain-containing protein [Sulfuricurvum sp.]
MKKFILLALIASLATLQAYDRYRDGYRGGYNNDRVNAFEIFDANKDGFVTKEEFSKAEEEKIRRIMEERRERGYGMRFEDIDTNKDGKISKEELLEAQLKRSNSRNYYNDRRGGRGCR